MVQPSIEKSSPDGPRYLNRIPCEDSRGEAIDDVVAAVAKNLRRTLTIEGTGHKDELEIPEEVYPKDLQSRKRGRCQLHKPNLSPYALSVRRAVSEI